MGFTTKFEALCRAMSTPQFYPHPVSSLERRDTHISTVFLTGTWVYKIKKPVDFGFLDFRKLEDRLKFCEREVSLNQRLSRDVYDKVVTIYKTNDLCFSLDKIGEVTEYAVKMRQLPEGASLMELLKKNKIRSLHMKKLGLALATFYEKSNRSSEINHYGQRDVIAFNMEENFRQLEPYVGTVLEKEKWECICQVCRSYFKDYSGLFDRRVTNGRICDGHGDLRTDHVYFHKGVQVIDCIEFNDRFRYGDAVADLAFLHMDMDHRGASVQSADFLIAYVAESRDPELYVLLDFYASYRAVVRLKINCLRLHEVSDTQRQFLKDEIARYMDQAYRYAIQFSRPTLWIFCGLPATGKSAISNQIAWILSAALFQSDRVRKEKLPFSQESVVPFGKGLYRSELRHYVYAELFGLAHEKLKSGRSVLLDATFSHSKWRNEAIQLAHDLDTNIIFVECVCDPETIRSRLKQRESESGVSDARLQHFPEMMMDFEPITEIAPENHIVVSTDQPLHATCAEVLSKGYARKCTQVEKIIDRVR